MSFRSPEENAKRADHRLTSMPIPCQVCRHMISMGSQFDPEGWTCAAYPEAIPYTVLTRAEDHTKHRMTQVGTKLYEGIVFEDLDTGREWAYRFDGSWFYLDEEGA